MDFPTLYTELIRAYEKDNFDLFKEKIDSVKNEHKFLFMLLLEVCMEGIQSKRCAEYFIDFFANELSDDELVLFIVSNNALLDRILRIKNLTVSEYNLRKDTEQKLRTSDNSKFDELMESISDKCFDFQGTENNINLIDGWLFTIKNF